LAIGTISPEEVMRTRKVVAVVGASKNPDKEANAVPRYLKEHGYRVIPINPTAETIVGEAAYPSLESLPDGVAGEVEVVDVFRPSEELAVVARDVVRLSKRVGRPCVFWAQLGLRSDEAARVLDEGGLPYVMDACMKIVHGALT